MEPRPTLTSDASHETRNRLVLEHVDLVKQVAGRLAHRLPAHVDVSELTSIGVIGLLDAAGRFKPSVGAPFGAFARRRIQGAMLDGLRELDWAPRAVRRMARQVDAIASKLRGRLGREPEASEMAGELGVSDEEYSRLSAALQTADQATVRQAGAGNDARMRVESVVDHAEMPDARVERLDTVRRLAEALNQLPPREREILKMYYENDLRMSDIARRMGVGESRISQLRGRALQRLRAMLADGGSPSAVSFRRVRPRQMRRMARVTSPRRTAKFPMSAPPSGAERAVA